MEAGKAKPGAGLLQTFVFSATLTLPQKLRKRLRKGVCRDCGLDSISLCPSVLWLMSMHTFSRVLPTLPCSLYFAKVSQ